MSSWDAGQYSIFLKERSLPSQDLIAKIALTNPKKILDVGSGPGNSTALLKERFPNAQVIGADLSDQMLEAARKNHPDLEFIKFDANCDFQTLPHDFDVVFSNACIQWLPDHKKVISEMFSILAPAGVLAVQVPVIQNEPIQAALDELGQREKWFSKIGIRSVFTIESESTYFNILAELTKEFAGWETTYCHRIPSLQGAIEWYRGTALRPYLDKLSDKDGELFCQELYDRIKDKYKPLANGEIILRFPRFFFTATKQN